MFDEVFNGCEQLRRFGVLTVRGNDEAVRVRDLVPGTVNDLDLLSGGVDASPQLIFVYVRIFVHRESLPKGPVCREDAAPSLAAAAYVT